MAFESYSVKAIGKLCEGKPHAQFDEGALETERWRKLHGHEIRNDGYRQAEACTLPRQCSTLLIILCKTQRQLLRCRRRMMEILHERGLKLSRKKSRMGSVNSSFHFLGIHYLPTRPEDNTDRMHANDESIISPSSEQSLIERGG